MTGALAAYVAAWNCADPVRRAELLAQSWAPGATYADPTVSLRGADELSAHIAGRIAARPGAIVEIVGDVRGHHQWATFAWQVRLEAAVLVSGVDAVAFGPDGRLSSVVGFFDPPADGSG